MASLLRWVIEPGFFSSSPVRVALLLGGLIAAISSVVGVFTVLRGQSFGGHALTDVSTAGGSGALLIGVAPVAGFVVGGVAGAGVMEVIGVRRPRGRDLATGIVLGAATGLAALFLYLDSTTTATTGASQQILFGSIFVLASSTIPYVVAFGLVTIGLICLVYRPLLLSSLNNDIARARGVPVRLIGAAYMLALALSVGLSSLVTGTILSTALLIGPPAAALRLTRRMNRAMVVAVLVGVGATWIGVLLAYDSYYWGSSRNGWPVSFFIVAVVFLVYLTSGLPARWVGRKAERASPVQLESVAG